MIPVSFIGIFLAFGLSDLSFDQGGFAAFVMLCGIVVNAGIYLVLAFKSVLSRRKNVRDDGTINDVRAYLKDDVKSYVKAFSLKINPILLTIVSTVLGLIPFLADGPKEVFWFDFAVGTISGMLFSLISIVLILPALVLRRTR